MRRRLRCSPRYPNQVRIGVPVVLASLTIGCNAILGWSDLHKSPASEDDEQSSSSSSGGGGSTSSSSGGASSSSGGPATPTCDLTKPFGAPVPVAGKVNTSAHETAPSLTADELTMFFQRTVGLDGGAILASTRAKIGDPWGEPVELTELAQNGADYSPSVTKDGLVLFWSEILTESPRFQKIKLATRSTPTAKFERVRVLDEVSNTDADDDAPSVAQDGSELFFTSTRQGGERRLFHSLRGQDGFGAPTLLTELAAGDWQTALSADGLTLFFGSSREGGVGKSDVWTAARPSKTAPFANIAHLDGPNTADHDWPTWISPDGCRLYLGVLGETAGDIVVATRP